MLLCYLTFPYSSRPRLLSPPAQATQTPHSGEEREKHLSNKKSDKTQTNRFGLSHGWQDVTQIEGYFNMSLTWFEDRTAVLYLQAVFICCCGNRIWKLILRVCSCAVESGPPQLMLRRIKRDDNRMCGAAAGCTHYAL